MNQINEAKKINLDDYNFSLLTDKEIEVFKRVITNQNITRLGDVATTHKQITTGADLFFVLNDKKVKQYNLTYLVEPIIYKTHDIKGILYDEAQYLINKENNLQTNLVILHDKLAENSEVARKYIKLGEVMGICKRAKCRNRHFWYEVPKQPAYPLLLPITFHEAPRLIINKTGSLCTDNALGVTTKLNKDNLAYCFINPLTAISAEIQGKPSNSGMLKLPPSTISSLLTPILFNETANITQLNHLIKEHGILHAMREHGTKILEIASVDSQDIQVLLDCWQRLVVKRKN